MRKLVFTLMCTVLLLQAIPMVSAQAQLPPPNYGLRCGADIRIDVDPETSTPPTDVMTCKITNDESYSLELSISSELNLLSAGHDDSIVVGANAEEEFSVEILGAEDRMEMATLVLTMSTEVTKTGELDYSDDEPQSTQAIVNIMQYAAFTFEPQQTDRDEKLEDDENFVVSYIMTNEGNFIDKFTVNTYAKATLVCDEDKPVETGNGASGCVLTAPVSDSCEEELTIFRKDKNGEDYEQSGISFFLDPGQSFTVTWTVSSNIGNASCWPTDSDGNYHLEFTHEVSASSEFGTRFENDDPWGQYDHSPIWIERTVDVTKSNDEGILASAVPGFESSYLLLCVLLAAIIHNRKSPLY
jgi:hypothetical protein